MMVVYVFAISAVYLCGVDMVIYDARVEIDLYNDKSKGWCQYFKMILGNPGNREILGIGNNYSKPWKLRLLS